MSATKDIDQLIADIRLATDLVAEKSLVRRLRGGAGTLDILKSALARLAEIRQTFSIPNDVEILDWLKTQLADPPAITGKVITPEVAERSAQRWLPSPDGPEPPVVVEPASLERLRRRRPKQCARCPNSFIPTGYQQPFCPSCVAAIDIENAEIRRQQIAADPEDDKRSESDTWPSSKVKGFPCGSCVNGKKNDLSESGFECTTSCARACAPWGPAWKYEAKA
jgi:hypothetical protein